MFLLKVEMKKNRDFPRLQSIEEILDSAFKFMIENLRNYYDEKDTNLIYMTITQPNFRSLRSGAYILQSESKNFFNYVSNMFHEFLNSNEEIELTNGFQVYFKVLSMSHVKYAKNRRKRRILGCRQPNEKKKFGPGLLDVPPGYPGFPLAFVNKCLLTSFLFGYFQAVDDQETFLKLKLLFARENYKKITGGDELKEKLQELQLKLGLPVCGPYNMDIVLPKLAMDYKCQIHVIQSLDQSAMIDSYPAEWDEGLPQIFLYLVSDNHVALVEKPKIFCRTNKQFCVGCKKTFAFNYRHKCNKRQSCSKCKSIITNTMECFKYTNIMPHQFCDSVIGDKLEISKQCSLCDIEFDTVNCFANHKQICGKQVGSIGFHCKKCDTFIKCQKTDQIDEGKINHVCDTDEKCQSCKKTKEPNHFCKLSKVKPTKIWPNLVFFDFQFQDISSANCKSCYLIREQFLKDHNLTWKELLLHPEIGNLSCDQHKNNQTNFTPNVMVLYQEKSRGSFTRHILTDDDLMTFTSSVDNVLESNYYGETTNVMRVNERLGRFNKEPKKTTLQEKKIDAMQRKTNKTVLDKFWILLRSEDFRNSTFLSINETSPNMVSNTLVKISS